MDQRVSLDHFLLLTRSVGSFFMHTSLESARGITFKFHFPHRFEFFFVHHRTYFVWSGAKNFFPSIFIGTPWNSEGTLPQPLLTLPEVVVVFPSLPFKPDQISFFPLHHPLTHSLTQKFKKKSKDKKNKKFLEFIKKHVLTIFYCSHGP
jgi:hypothetical protein